MVNNLCNLCNLCDSCKFCNFCDFCDFCDSCNSCKKCKNLVNGFMCINLKFDKKDESKYWIFNKEVSKEEWDKRWDMGKSKVCSKCGRPLKEDE